MQEREVKSPINSHTVMTELVLQSHINGAGRLFGGQLMSWMDIVGAICAKRHCNCDVVTARVERIDFFAPAMPNDVVVLTANLESVGTTSMRVNIDVEVEYYKKNIGHHKICNASFTFVAMDENGNKQTVPLLE